MFLNEHIGTLCPIGSFTVEILRTLKDRPTTVDLRSPARCSLDIVCFRNEGLCEIRREASCKELRLSCFKESADEWTSEPNVSETHRAQGWRDRAAIFFPLWSGRGDAASGLRILDS